MFCLFIILQANIEHCQVSQLEGDGAMPLQCMSQCNMFSAAGAKHQQAIPKQEA